MLNLRLAERRHRSTRARHPSARPDRGVQSSAGGGFARDGAEARPGGAACGGGNGGGGGEGGEEREAAGAQGRLAVLIPQGALDESRCGTLRFDVLVLYLQSRSRQCFAQPDLSRAPQWPSPPLPSSLTVEPCTAAPNHANQTLPKLICTKSQDSGLRTSDCAGGANRETGCGAAVFDPAGGRSANATRSAASATPQ